MLEEEVKELHSVVQPAKAYEDEFVMMCGPGEQLTGC